MKILLLDADLRFMTPTRSLWLRVLESIGDTHIFGPGYVARGYLWAGVERFAAEHGPFDVIVSTEHISMAPASLFSPSQYRRNFMTTCHPEYLEWCPSIANEAARLPGLHVASLMETDYQYLTEAQVACLERFPLVIGPGKQFIVPRESVDDEPSFLGPLSNAWWTFVNETRPDVVPLPLFVSDSAECATALAMRPYAWSVPGVGYVQRKAMRRALKQRLCKVRRASFRWGGLLSRLGVRPWTWNWFLAQYQARFFRELRSSRYVYTCGSALRLPLLKFFEIPAAGAVLVCQPCHGFAALGFVSGMNAIAGEDHHDLISCVQALTPDRLQAIAHAGRRLVMTQHTVQARAMQLKRVLELAIAGRYHSSYWAAGRFLVRTPATVTQLGPDN